jgi:diguanylate cyclase (GGDEF)-like protein
VAPRVDTETTSHTDADARQTGFVQCVTALRRTLTTTPVGWALVVWMCWGRAPPVQVGLWLAVFGVVWAGSLLTLRVIARRGPRDTTDTRTVLLIAGLDGAAWGAVVGLLMGFDRTLDPWLTAVLCGVSAVNAPVYITFVRAYRVQILSLWLSAMLGSVLLAGPGQVPMEVRFGLTVFLALITYYMQSIADRVVEGIRLQFANALLARQLREALALVEQDAATDALTGLPNRRALDLLLAQQLERSGSAGPPVSVLLMDVDHFKAINDRHGHSVGDDALRAFARRVRDLLREGEVCARYGGEEFVVVLPETALPLALEVAERVRAGVAATPLLKAPLLAVTVSIGAAQLRPGQKAGALLEAADQAVYAAKHAGRNQVQAAPAGGP